MNRAALPSTRRPASVRPCLLLPLALAGCGLSATLDAYSEPPAEPRRSAASLDPAFYGISGESGGFGDAQAQALRGLGAGLVRLQANDWPAQRDALSRKVDAARRAGLRVLLELYYDTLPEGVAGRSDSDRQRYWHADFSDAGNPFCARFTAAAGDIAAFFKGRVSAYEIWNEPNAAPRPARGFRAAPLTYPSPDNADWDGACGAYLYGVDYGQGAWALCPRQLGAITTNAFMAIKAKDPAATVVAGNVLFHGTDGWVAKEYWQEVEQSPAVAWHRATRGRLPWDVVGIHPYGYAPRPSRALRDQTARFAALLRAAGDPARLALTEYGWDASPDAAGRVDAIAGEAAQASALKAAFLDAQEESAAFVIWFNYNDWTEPGPAGTRLISFGVRRTDGSWKPAARAFCEAAGQLTCADGSRLPPAPAVGRDETGVDYPAITACWSRSGGAAAAGAPFDNGGSAHVHVWGSGRVQDFAGGALGPSLCMQQEGRTAAYMVRGGIREAYLRASGGGGWLGYPTEDEHGSERGPLQRFRGGYITWDAAAGRFEAYR